MLALSRETTKPCVYCTCSLIYGWLYLTTFSTNSLKLHHIVTGVPMLEYLMYFCIISETEMEEKLAGEGSSTCSKT